MVFVETTITAILSARQRAGKQRKTFTKEHYTFIAHAFNSNPEHPLLQLVGMLELDNPAFDKAKFLEAINKKK